MEYVTVFNLKTKKNYNKIYSRINTFLIASAAKRKEPINIVMLGPEKAGKTALICRYLQKDFPLKHKPTSEQTYHSTYTLAGVKLKLEILDTSGKNEVRTNSIIIHP